MSRYHQLEIEQAHKIVNDIAEDIDCGESRKVLRRALAIYAELLMEKCQREEMQRLEIFGHHLNELKKVWERIQSNPAFNQPIEISEHTTTDNTKGTR